MLLAIDVGNTNIVLGVFDGDRLAVSWRLATRRELTSDELGLLVDGLFAHDHLETRNVHAVIVSSVVPPLTGTVRAMAERCFGVKAIFVDPERAGMPNVTEQPAEVGADRIVNAIAAYAQWGRTEPRTIVVVDFGTATTFDAISPKGEYLGGAICPGVQISADALFQRAARLPRIDVRKPSKVVGTTTVGAMEAGLFYGYVGMVEGLLRRTVDELGGDALCVATGGLAPIIAPEIPAISHVDPDLTLRGLKIVFERSQS
jgi:type III pantothenate kinase